MSILEFVILISLGAAGGFLSGLLGVGGGIIFIPVFEYYFGTLMGVEGEELVRFILANSFGAILVAGIASSLKQRKLGNFHPKKIIAVAIPAIITGSIVTSLIAKQSWYKEEYFKILFVVILFYTMVRSMIRKPATQENEPKVRKRVLPLVGVAAGAVSALSGLGGGVAMIPLLTGAAKMDIKKASAVSIGVIPIMVLPYLVIYGMQQPTAPIRGLVGYLSPAALLPIAIGVLIFSSVGVKVAHRSKETVLRIIFASLILVLIIKFTIGLIQ